MNKKRKYEYPSGVSSETINVIETILNELPADIVNNKTDKLSISLLLRNYELMIRAYDQILENGMITDKNEISPSFSIYKTMMTSCLGIIRDYGLTAKSRRLFPQFNEIEKSGLDLFLEDDIDSSSNTRKRVKKNK